jgi:short subunit dehydrogenase-like uncharacterized protein
MGRFNEAADPQMALAARAERPRVLRLHTDLKIALPALEEDHHEEAKRTGARIVFSCGFDSIPFDLGVLTLQEKAREKFGRPARRVKARLRKVKGGMSGGTAASAQATLAAAARDPALMR